VRNRAAPEVRVRKTAQKFSGAPAQVLHEKVEMVERVEGRLVHMCIYQYLYVLVCSPLIKNALNTIACIQKAHSHSHLSLTRMRCTQVGLKCE
jgi:hypothetical protein